MSADTSEEQALSEEQLAALHERGAAGLASLFRETAGLLESAAVLAATEGRLAWRALWSLALTAVCVAAFGGLTILLLHAAMAFALVEFGMRWSLALLAVAAVDVLAIALLALYRRSLHTRLGFPATRALLRGSVAPNGQNL